MPNPTVSTADAIREEDQIVKIEVLPEPSVTTDYAQNSSVESALNVVSRIAEHVIGDALISGMTVAKDGSNITVAPGKMMAASYFINKISASTVSVCRSS